MKLIDEDKNIVQVYLVRKIVDINGDLIDGKRFGICKFMENEMFYDYAEWKVNMSIITSKMNYFIYQVNKSNLELKEYNDKMGNIIYIEDGDKYFTKDKFNREMLQGVGGIDFI